jgi:hypothetical protein
MDTKISQIDRRFITTSPSGNATGDGACKVWEVAGACPEPRDFISNIDLSTLDIMYVDITSLSSSGNLRP